MLKFENHGSRTTCYAQLSAQERCCSECLTQPLRRVQGVDRRSQPSKSSVLGSISLPPPRHPVPITTLYAIALRITLPSQGPLPLLRRPTSVSEGTWCRQGGELPKETGIDVALARSPPNRSKTPRTHKEPLQRHRFGPGPSPQEPAPPTHSGAIFELRVVTMEYVTPPRPAPAQPLSAQGSCRGQLAKSCFSIG